MLFFPAGPGVVAAVTDPAVQGSLIPLSMSGGTPLHYEEQRSIVTRVVGSPKVNLQLLHSLGAWVYAYVFGDRSSDLVVSGLAFARNCRDGEQGQHGVEHLLKWYQKNRASSKIPILRVMVGEIGFDGLLTDFQFDLNDAETGVAPWAAHLVTLPERAA